MMNNGKGLGALKVKLKTIFVCLFDCRLLFNFFG